MKRAQVICVFSVCMSILASLACASENAIGELPTDCSQTTFTLRGEIDTTWTANISSTTKYQLSIKPVQTDHPLGQLRVQIYSVDKDGRSLMVEGPESLDVQDNLLIEFDGPDSGRILVKVLSLVGENGEDLGQFSVALCTMNE